MPPDELTIQVNSTTGKVLAQTPGGAEANGQLDLDPLRRDTIRVFEDWLRRDRISLRQELIVLGHHLYHALFRLGPVGTSPADLLKQRLEAVQKTRGARLRLQLRFTEDNAQLIRLPWEFLYSPERRQFLATDVNLVLSRFIPLTVDREPLHREAGSLRILVLVSRPRDQQDVIAKEVVAAIEQLPNVQVSVIKNSTIDALEAALTDYRPHVFHFIGHGSYDTESGGSLALVNPDTGTSDPLDDVTLIQSFQAREVFPRLVFLHMCDGGAVDGDASALQAFSGFAPRLMHARIPAVVAMQYPIRNVDAQEFAVAFYRKLAAGGSIDEAVQDGRYNIDRLRKTRVFGTPVLYMHSSDGIILPPLAVTPPAPVGYAAQAQAKPEDDVAVSSETTPTRALHSFDEAGIDALIRIGSGKMRELGDDRLRGRLQLRLPEVRARLLGKSVNDVVTCLFDEWESAEPAAKSIWQAMLHFAETSSR